MRILKGILRDILYIVAVLRDTLLRRRGLSILMYHSAVTDSDGTDNIGATVSRGHFQAQMSYLVDNGYDVMSLEDGVAALRVEKRLSAKAVCITFDDGYADNYTNAYPVLKRLNLPATIFVVSSYVVEPRMLEHLLKHDVRAMSLSHNQLKVLNSCDLISLGFHGKSHVRLATLDDEALVAELEDGMRELREAGITTGLFAYPYGGKSTFNDSVISLLKRQGIHAACTTVPGRNCVGDNTFHLKRIYVGPDDDIRIFRDKLAGSDKWVSFLIKCARMFKSK